MGRRDTTTKLDSVTYGRPRCTASDNTFSGFLSACRSGLLREGLGHPHRRRFFVPVAGGVEGGDDGVAARTSSRAVPLRAGCCRTSPARSLRRPGTSFVALAARDPGSCGSSPRSATRRRPPPHRSSCASAAGPPRRRSHECRTPDRHGDLILTEVGRRSTSSGARRSGGTDSSPGRVLQGAAFGCGGACADEAVTDLGGTAHRGRGVHGTASIVGEHLPDRRR